MSGGVGCFVPVDRDGIMTRQLEHADSSSCRMRMVLAARARHLVESGGRPEISHRGSYAASTGGLSAAASAASDSSGVAVERARWKRCSDTTAAERAVFSRSAS